MGVRTRSSIVLVARSAVAALRSFWIVSSALFVAASPSSATAATITVGSSADVDFTSIQSALDAAAAGDEVLVLPGVYDSGRPLDFNRLRDPDDPDGPPVRDVVLRSAAGPGRTVITLTRRNWPNSESVVLFRSGETRDSLLQGFTIESRGFGTPVAAEGTTRRVGGAMYCSGGSAPTIRDCVITGPQTPSESLVHIEGAAPLLEGCRIERSALGVHCVAAAPVLRDCVISDTYAYGLVLTAEASPTLERCEILRCRPGGVSVRDGSRLRMSDCLIAVNRGDDGGIICQGGSSIALERCIVAGNVGDDNGGGILARDSTVSLRSCVIAANFTESAAGAIDAGTSRVELLGSTVAGNAQERLEAVSLGDGSRVVNSIIWANAAVFSQQPNLVTQGAVEVSHSCIESGEPWPGQGNIALDPRFVDPVSYFDLEFLFEEADLSRIFDGGFDLRADSPCLDAGTADDTLIADLTGNARPCGAGVDQGAYERGDCFTEPPFRRGDADGSGAIGLSDALFVLRRLFLDGPPLPCEKAGDVDDSGTLQLTDPVRILGHLFSGAAAPPAPFRVCGPDPTGDGLSCEAFPPCR